MSWIWKLERKFGRYAIPHLVKYLAILNAAAFIVLFVMAPDARAFVYNALALIPSEIARGQVWRLVTFLLLPETMNPLFAGLSIYLFYIIGTAVEQNWGAFRFNLYYLIGWAGTLVAALIAGLLGAQFTSTTATYLNLSLFLAFATMFPDYQLLLFFFLPVKVKWLGWLEAAFLAFTIVSSLVSGYWAGALAPLVSLANYLLFFGHDLFKFVHRKRKVHHNRRRFFDAVNQANAAREARNRHDDNIRRF